jgi:hypothetical protein
LSKISDPLVYSLESESDAVLAPRLHLESAPFRTGLQIGDCNLRRPPAVSMPIRDEAGQNSVIVEGADGPTSQPTVPAPHDHARFILRKRD